MATRLFVNSVQVRNRKDGSGRFVYLLVHPAGEAIKEDTSFEFAVAAQQQDKWVEVWDQLIKSNEEAKASGKPVEGYILEGDFTILDSSAWEGKSTKTGAFTKKITHKVASENAVLRRVKKNGGGSTVTFL